MAQEQTGLKIAHYSQQLQSALIRGAWADLAPAKAANGTPISWSELLRKYKKHSTSHHITAELALQTQSLSLLLLPASTDARNIRPDDLDGDSVDSSNSLELGDECQLSKARVEEGRLGFAALELLNDTPDERESTLLTRAYFAYALKRYKECLALLYSMKFGDEMLPLTTTQSSTLTVPGAGGTHLRWTGSILSVDVDERDSKMWRVIEIVRGRCLQGMAREKASKVTEALHAYEAAIPFLEKLDIPRSTASETNTGPDPAFVRYRELWRWSERLLWRASCLASRHAPLQKAFTIFRLYATQSLFFPATFRPNHRAVVTALHINALLLTSPGAPLAFPNQTKLAWITEARTLISDYRIVLASCTQFPRAGERNSRVEEYCDAVIAVWERCGATGDDAKWAIDILWWASRMTFHSHRIFRHLVRLLHAAGENDLARRTFKLYIQLVTKAQQAQIGEVESSCRRRRTGDFESGSSFEEDIDLPELEGGHDSDRQFVDCVISGARMLCRLQGDVEEARWSVECLGIAREVIQKNQKLGRDKHLRARLSCADGLALLTLAHREAEPTTRPALMRRAVDHFESAVQFNHDSADNFYHLAVSLLQAGPTRNIDESIRAARQAVELESNEIRYWHLLGLALSAQGQYVQSREVLEIGEALETGEDNDATNEEQNTSSAAESVTEEPRSESPMTIETLLQPGDTFAPSASRMLLPIPDHPAPSKEDQFEHGLQLRMTLLSLIELIDGAEVASVKWLSIFAWFAERGGWASAPEERRSSFELPPIDPIPSSVSGESSTEEPTRPTLPQLTLVRSSSPSHRNSVPITVVPPSPRENGDSDSVRTLRFPGEKETDVSRRKKAQRMIKEQVNKRQYQIQTFSRKLSRTSSLKSQMSRFSSTPDFMLGGDRSYQASSIHSRHRMSPRASYVGSTLRLLAPTPTPPSLAVISEQRSEREKRLIADLWLTSAATFRRMGKLEQARAAIQEAETLDENNAAVWVQLGLCFAANGEVAAAINSFHKALVIEPDYIPAIVHLAQQYVNPAIGQTSTIAHEEVESRHGGVDLAAGMLSSFTKGVGWDIPEAWYLLAKAVSLQGRKERERECLIYALGLVEGKPIRDIRTALGYAL